MVSRLVSLEESESDGVVYVCMYVVPARGILASRPWCQALRISYISIRN